MKLFLYCVTLIQELSIATLLSPSFTRGHSVINGLVSVLQSSVQNYYSSFLGSNTISLKDCNFGVWTYYHSPIDRSNVGTTIKLYIDESAYKMGGKNFVNPISNDPKSNFTAEELGLVILRTIFTKRYCYVVQYYC